MSRSAREGPREDRGGGEVALDGCERPPLFGQRVLVTRAAEQADEMVGALRDVGAEVLVVPLIRLVAPANWAEVDRALDRLEDYDVLLLTSANAVRFLAERAAVRGIPLKGRPWEVVCVGERTAEAARREGLAVGRVPESRFDAEGLLAEIENHLPPSGRRFLLPRSETAREVLPGGLRRAGAVVDAVTAYRHAPPESGRRELLERLLAGEIDALTFTSPSTVERFAALLDDEARRAARRCLVAAIGPVTAEALRRSGLEPDVVPERASARDLVAALVRRVARGPGGGSP